VHRTTRLVYPVAFAAAAVIQVAAANTGQYRGSDLLLMVLAAIGIGVSIIALAFLIVWLTRADAPHERAAPLAALALGWFFYFFPIQSAVATVSWRLSRPIVVVPLGLVISVAAIVWILRQPADRIRPVNRFGAVFGITLLTLTVVRLVTAGAAGSRTLARSALARDLATPVRAGPLPARNVPPRDIYLIILDEHANAHVRRSVFGDSTTVFEDSLRALGFVIPPNVSSNYTQTILSLPSILSFEHMTRLADDVGVTSTDYALPEFLIENNRAARFLKARGYRYLLFPSAWWSGTQFSPLADSIYLPSGRLSLTDALRRTEFRAVVWGSTLLHPLLRRTKFPDLRKFEALKDVPLDSAPTFAFAHETVPHLPYVFDADCRPLARPTTAKEEANTPAQRAAYLAQMACVDRITLGTVREILRRSATPPIILILGDHGSRFSDVRYYEHPESASPQFLDERFGAFAAAYLPAGGDSILAHPITLVNVFRGVLSYYFGAQLPPLPDAHYVSGDRPYRFRQVELPTRAAADR
jgi:hypothetical protein